jgi:ABC-type glycerol-3-phosphate transport system substrate-binding protein
VSPVGGNVWVVSARASDDEIAAAIRLIAWATEPPQQAALAIYGDGLPATAGAVDEPALRDYWHDLPLFRDAWDAVNEKPLLLREWTRVMGGYVTIPRLLHEVVIGSEDFDLAWGRVIELMDASETAQERDAETLFRCVSEHVQDERSPLEACT